MQAPSRPAGFSYWGKDAHLSLPAGYRQMGVLLFCVFSCSPVPSIGGNPEITWGTEEPRIDAGLEDMCF